MDLRATDQTSPKGDNCKIGNMFTFQYFENPLFQKTWPISADIIDL